MCMCVRRGFAHTEGDLQSPWVLDKTPIEKEFHTCIHIHICTFQSFFSADLGGCFTKPLYRGSFANPTGPLHIQRVFTYSYIYTYLHGYAHFGLFPIDMGVHISLYRGGFMKPLGTSKSP